MLAAICYELDQPVRVEEVDLDAPKRGEVLVRMAASPLTLIIFGASGDLTARKLIPSLYNLDRKKRLPAELRIVGVARSPFSDDAFREPPVTVPVFLLFEPLLKRARSLVFAR